MEIIGDLLAEDGPLKSVIDLFGHLIPADMLEHEGARQHHRSRVDLILVSILGRSAVGGFEDGMT